MLSPHEFTTLMLVEDAPDQIETDREELHVLRERQLVIFELLASGQRRPRITQHGRAVLKAVAQLSSATSVRQRNAADMTGMDNALLDR